MATKVDTRTPNSYHFAPGREISIAIILEDAKARWGSTVTPADLYIRNCETILDVYCKREIVKESVEEKAARVASSDWYI